MTESPATETLTIRLPTASAWRLHRVGEIACRPVDDVVAEVLDAGLPPLLDAVPEAMRGDLARIEGLSDDALWERLHAQLDSQEVERYDALLEANAAGALDHAGHDALRELRTTADRLIFEKAYAALLLKWRGQFVPSLADLELSAKLG